MKKNITIALLTVMALSFGCKKITDINVSPNDPSITNATPDILFPSGVAATAGRIGGSINILGGIWAELYTQDPLANQYLNIDDYNLTKNDFTSDYSVLFAGALEDYQTAIISAKAKGEYNYVLMATCMKAYTYEVLADLYDEVPYTQALQGAANIQPAFDKGPVVYEGLLKEIQTALAANYNVGLTNPATDFVFGADGNEMTEWAEFAHTLELKMYLRMVNANPSEAQAGVTALYASPDFLSVNAGMTQFINTPNKDNPFYEYNIRSLNTAVNLKASVTFTSYLAATNDTLRANAYFGTPTPINNSVNQGDFTGTYSNSPVSPVQTPTDPVWFISAAESYFLQAEAVARYGVAGDAAALYLQGIEASFEANGLTAAQADAYAAQASVAYPVGGSLDAQIGAIITQKWVASAQGCHTLEAVFDQWRTGYPKISPVYSTSDSYVSGQWVYSKNGVTPSNLFPKRLIYPKFEVDENKNAPPIVAITVPVWWALSTTQDQ